MGLLSMHSVGAFTKMTALALTLALTSSNSANAADKFAEICSGTETLQVGTQPPKKLPYTLTFSADLTTKSYCYDVCDPDQAYAISDSSSQPIKLSDFDDDDRQTGGQRRLITFDRRSKILTDFWVLNAGGLGTVVKNATATCRASAFHQPAPLPNLERH